MHRNIKLIHPIYIFMVLKNNGRYICVMLKYCYIKFTDVPLCVVICIDL
jgi:hypothetical protein